MSRGALVPAAFAICCLPLPWLGYQFATGGLGANPVEALLNDLGYLAFILLACTLACTPMQILLGWTWPLLIRKLLGDFCFFYACLHLLTYTVIDQGFDFQAITADVLKHRFIFLGMGTWILLLPLAITSTRGWQRRLGFRQWKRLHRLVYLAGGLASFHFLLRFKTPRLETLAWMSAIAALLFVRAVAAARRRATMVQSP
ncbi:MAG TPA: protein-methionine-sulfoxide reductase heme-binding subunit MsrQ [Myxococcales bacterium]|nr:protein-methionine-sulfoxide reductase heme-binding subunit MsrQ [Myxococcales bacterium]